MRNYILSLFFLFAISNVANAQTVNPDSLLDGSPPIMVPNDQSESKKSDDKSDKNAEEDDKNPPAAYDETGWMTHNRLLQCHTIGNVRDYTMSRGQNIIISGFKAPNYVPSDPFEGMIITQNHLTGEYILLLVQVSTGFTCIVQMGTALQSTQDVIKQLEEYNKEK
tara:strand:- start:234 stop:731 length:498 start_codon:yes stop_codon:yes gene_type:complete